MIIDGKKIAAEVEVEVRSLLATLPFKPALVAVRVAFAKGVAPYIRERLWHPTQKLRDLPDGRLELTLQVADTQEVRRWILGWGAQAEVIHPTAMREALRQEALAMVEKLGRRGPGLARVEGAKMMRQIAK